MAKTEFEPGKNLGEEIRNMNRQEICELVIEACKVVRSEAGEGYRGGIYPENMRRDAAGELVIGDGRSSDWDGQELDFIAPELYWHGKQSQAADVYSLGLLLYYGLTGGKLPFSGESSNAQLARMSGQPIRAPRGCGPRLTEVLEKALAFQAEDRFQRAEELAVMLDSCLENRYLSGGEAARDLFRKEEGELSELEKMMMAIIGGDEEGEASAPAADTPAQEPVEEKSAEEAMEEILGQHAAPEPAAPEKDPLAESAEDLVAEFFGTKLVDPEEARAHIRPIMIPQEEPDDVRVYEPKGEKQRNIPILTEEKNPELAPVVPKSQPRRREVRYSADPERSRQIDEEVQTRRNKRPLLVVLILCVLLLGAAAGVRFYLQAMNRPDPSIGVKTASTPTPGENAPQMGEDGTGSIVTPLPDPLIGGEVRYEVFVDDAGWIEARAKAESAGGHLAVITSPKELEKVAEAIGKAGLARAWIGCHRFNGQYEWETDEYISYYPWDQNEPSEVDAYDGAAEDFIMLWNHNGWCYNDSRENPAGDFPEYYSGSIGYVVEFGVGE